MIDVGNEYPTLVRAPRSGKKKILLTKYDYISLAEESDFYIVEFTADQKEATYYDDYQRVRSDALDLRWFKDSNFRYDPRLAEKKSITIKFHDGILNGEKFTFEEKDKITIGRSTNCDIVLTPNDNAGQSSNIA